MKLSSEVKERILAYAVGIVIAVALVGLNILGNLADKFL